MGKGFVYNLAYGFAAGIGAAVGWQLVLFSGLYAWSQGWV